ncbi:DUF423 domain-containing protein [Emcibacter nanhaiensis]|uniref:DUF423 domain-containing protein n=2 Tax=Emcibacter nanhaiensis TaxID=1505037 RepID=A0A501PBU4_9PROT|nr:DUF423 domain-containing protein [Emcibacter nanhaiensis]
MTFWRLFFVLAALNGFLAVMLGAAGSHILAPKMIPGGPDFFSLASQYHIWHSLALLSLSLFSLKQSACKDMIPRLSALFFLIGIALFSGNLYARAFNDPYSLSFLIPIGGTFLMAGWLLLALSVICIGGNNNSK